jgi:hypothetical protein
MKKMNHRYSDYLEELKENPAIRVVEMDTVIGTKGGKVLQTIYWRKEKLMLAFLLEKTQIMHPMTRRIRWFFLLRV